MEYYVIINVIFVQYRMNIKNEMMHNFGWRKYFNQNYKLISDVKMFWTENNIAIFIITLA